MKKVIIIIASLIALMSFSITAYAGNKCSHPGCDRGTDSGSYCRLHKCGYTGCNSEIGNNGSIYCDRHAREKLGSSSTYKNSCISSGCYRSKQKGSNYCSQHQPTSTQTTSKSTSTKRKCRINSCHNARVSSGQLCSYHTCSKSGCYKQVKSNGEKYCVEHLSVQNTKSKTSKNTSKTKIKMPDCDDYEDYDDFMNEWDGCMPDGSDAEDYWENW